MTKMEERSAGIILYRKGPQGREYLLLQHPEGHWGFPKGHIEGEEDPREAARRELCEETGIRVIEVVAGFQEEVEYEFEREAQPVHKRVTYFLGETDEGEVRLSKEHLAYSWLGYPEALERLTYESSRALLRRAERFLNEVGSHSRAS